MKSDCYIFDLDGTLADTSHRQYLVTGEKKQWDAFFCACDMDKPIWHMIGLFRTLQQGCPTLITSGRSDQVRDKTEKWLWDKRVYPSKLYMRRHGDHRPDDDVKAEMLEKIIKDGYNPLMVFEDRTRVVKMWRSRGIPCAQVAEGDF